MRITSTGHAGLFIETKHGSVLCDPWRTPAYFASWFVFPDNSEIDFAELRPDYLYVSHLHHDHFDPVLLKALISKSTPVLLPDFATGELRAALEELGFSSFVQTRNCEPLELDGLTVVIGAMSAPADGPLGDSALVVDDGDFRLLNQNDSRPRNLEPLLDLGHYDAHTLQFSGAIWWPVVYDLADATKRAIGQRKRQNGMERARRFIEAVGASFVFPNSGPAAFLDSDLFSYNDFENSEENPFPDQAAFLRFLEAHGHDNGRLLIPGSAAELSRGTAGGPTICALTHPKPDEEIKAIFSDKRAYLESYAAREKEHVADLKASWPPYEGDLVEALAEWFEPLLAKADHIGPGVGGPVLLVIGEEEIIVEFAERAVRRRTNEECRYKLVVARELIEALVAEHEIDWVNSLFLSLRFSAWRRGQYVEQLWTFFKCLSEERISHAEAWYAEQEPDEFVQIGDYMVQRNCPHLRADLTQYGELHGNILRCCMHGWTFDLSTGKCLNSDNHRIRCFRAESADENVIRPVAKGRPA